MTLAKAVFVPCTLNAVIVSFVSPRDQKTAGRPRYRANRTPGQMRPCAAHTCPARDIRSNKLGHRNLPVGSSVSGRMAPGSPKRRGPSGPAVISHHGGASIFGTAETHPRRPSMQIGRASASLRFRIAGAATPASSENLAGGTRWR
jgi:acetyl esterase/lipase